MRAMDRTLLASLGFADGDKRDGRHGLACQYLARPEIAVPVLRSTVASQVAEDDYLRGRFEVPIGKGDGKFKTTVGFIDLVYVFNLDVIYEERAKVHSYPQDHEAFVEVKAGRVEVADAIRQINLYREYVGTRNPWILAAAYPLTALEIEAVRSARIHPVILGAKFDAWCESAKAAPAADAPSITF